VDQITCMKAFVTVAEENGFSAAGRKLGLSKVLVSKYVAQLEETLSVRLFERTTRRVSLSTVGSAYLERCAGLVDEFEKLHQAVQAQHQNPQGTLKLTAPVTFAENKLVDVIDRFTRQYPELEFDLQLSERTIDIQAEGIDLAIQIGESTDEQLINQPLGVINNYLCASPEYIKQHGEPQMLPDLSQHRLIADSNFRQGKFWQFSPKNSEIKTSVAIQTNININSARAVKELLIKGQGIGICPDFVINDEFDNGELVVLLPQWQIASCALIAVYPKKRHLSDKVRLFIDALALHLTKSA